MSLEIVSISRGKVSFILDGEEMNIQGEALMPGYGDFDYVLYKNTLSSKEVKGDTMMLLVNALEEKGMKVDVE